MIILFQPQFFAHAGSPIVTLRMVGKSRKGAMTKYPGLLDWW